MSSEEITAQALTLPYEDRLSLTAKLITSFDANESPADLDELWLETAESRLRSIDRGEVTPIPAEEAYRRLKQRFC